MSSHLVPALRALLPVAFLCEVRVATRLSSFPVGWSHQIMFSFLYVLFRCCGPSAHGWMRL